MRPSRVESSDYAPSAKPPGPSAPSRRPVVRLLRRRHRPGQARPAISFRRDTAHGVNYEYESLLLGRLPSRPISTSILSTLVLHRTAPHRSTLFLFALFFFLQPSYARLVLVNFAKATRPLSLFRRRIAVHWPMCDAISVKPRRDKRGYSFASYAPPYRLYAYAYLT